MLIAGVLGIPLLKAQPNRGEGTVWFCSDRLVFGSGPPPPGSRPKCCQSAPPGTEGAEFFWNQPNLAQIHFWPVFESFCPSGSGDPPPMGSEGADFWKRTVTPGNPWYGSGRGRVPHDDGPAGAAEDRHADRHGGAGRHGGHRAGHLPPSGPPPPPPQRGPPRRGWASPTQPPTHPPEAGWQQADQLTQKQKRQNYCWIWVSANVLTGTESFANLNLDQMVNGFFEYFPTFSTYGRRTKTRGQLRPQAVCSQPIHRTGAIGRLVGGSGSPTAPKREVSWASGVATPLTS